MRVYARESEHVCKDCWPTFSSLSHFSSSCFFPCCSTGRHSSNASYLLSWALSEVDLSSSRLKYCRTGAVWPGCVGACWKRWMVSGVRRIPWRRAWGECGCHTSVRTVGSTNTPTGKGGSSHFGQPPPPPQGLGCLVSQEHTHCFHCHAHKADSSERWLVQHHRHLSLPPPPPTPSASSYV